MLLSPLHNLPKPLQYVYTFGTDNAQRLSQQVNLATARLQRPLLQLPTRSTFQSPCDRLRFSHRCRRTGDFACVGGPDINTEVCNVLDYTAAWSRLLGVPLL